jgi:membrane protein YdbS with pleckstrin-like domain
MAQPPAEPAGTAGPGPGRADDDTHIIAMAQVPDNRGWPDQEDPDQEDLDQEDLDQEDLDADFGADRAGAGRDERPHIDPEELKDLPGADIGGSIGVRRVLPLEDEPSPLVSRYLFPTERYRGEWKKHHIHLLPPMSIGVIATFVLGWISGSLAWLNAWGWLIWVIVLVWLGVMGYVAWRVADWHFDRFILTNKRVMVVRGIITRQVGMMPLLRVTDMKYEQSPLGRMLNYGTFVLESAGQDQALREIDQLPNPNELYLRVVEEMYEPAAVEARYGRDSEESEEEQRAGDS